MESGQFKRAGGGQGASVKLVLSDGSEYVQAGKLQGFQRDGEIVPGIRAALTHDTYSAERAAKSNNAQVITMGARVIGPELAKAIVDTWLASSFDPTGPSAANVDAINRLDKPRA